ncbi:radical SAM protein [Actinotalea sp.]|uniref:radical SAM protein n=1 Tax=Actinotalea sp. TaxID=1872145 RepID=UPI003566C4B3
MSGTGAPLRGAASAVGRLDAPAGAYVHVPFCAWICPFCPYNKVRADPDLAERYFAALAREVDSIETAHRRRFGRSFDSVYVGGGTPTLYPDALGDLLERLPTSGDRAVEVLPTHGTPEGLDRLAAAGFTAVSIGAQSFHDEVLRHLGRPHDAEAARSAMESAIGRFDCVDVDLIVDVALESAGEDSVAPPGAFLSDVEACFDAGVDQLSTYPLMRFGYTPFGRAPHLRAREHAVLRQVTGLARRMGYERRSVWTFNRAGAPAYTSITRRRFLGMGAGASSVTGRDFLVNHFGLRSYLAAVDADHLPLARLLHLGRWGGAAYDAFWQAYAGGLSPTTLADAYGRPVGALARAALEPARWAGLLRSAEGDLRLTARGLDAFHDLERAVTYQLIEPLWAEMLQEHAAEGDDTAPSCPPRASCRPVGTAHEAAGPAPGSAWVRQGAGRSGRLWRLTRRWAEREPDWSGSPG